MLKQSNIWFRKQGVPLIIPARQRALEAFHAPCRGFCGLASCTSAISSCATFSLLVVEDEGFPTELHQSSHKR